jgi:hypothetical protein
MLVAGCASTMSDTQRYERALDRIERETLGVYCTRYHHFVRVDGEVAVDGAADDAKHACVATLASKADRPDQRKARVRMLRCMLEAGWVIGEQPAGSPDVPVELDRVCLSDGPRSATPEQPAALAETGAIR